MIYGLSVRRYMADAAFGGPDLNDSGGGRSWLLIVLCLLSAVVSG
jgi:hypothetical protein